MGELEAIRTFLTVAEQSSFSAAARRLGMTPASVTRTVSGLEEELGVQLLLRTTRKVSLTSAGAAYAARVAPLVQGLARATEETRDLQKVTAGSLRVSAPMSLGMKVLPTVLSQFSIIHPRTSVAIELSDRFVDILQENYDLAIRISGPPTDKSTIWRKIRPVPRVLVASPSFLARNGIPKVPEDLTTLECLSYHDQSKTETWELSRPGQSRIVEAKGRFSINNGDFLGRLAVAGEGIALLPRFIVEEDLAAGRLVEVLPGWSTPEIWLTLFYPPYEQLPLRVATFSDFFEAFIRESWDAGAPT
ncbi:MAG: LysR family transcriptional regulator [Allorhizobium sp.]|jgi:DNA-binding transcriptional LysR family regulator|uniref:LysR family transcriptional regulator n=1 Tax=Rhizobium rosettiformans TaxID=1368430 RepID=A0ABX7ERL2_9HYPH|nr:LysR family transcriptional regulator [Rhizobium rosettiformans]ODS58294.1 MAG: LysR family transcriptional regulator [Agrobacterium sp. SCN 61-19]QRF50893.1 LysR family transcriptional regulator [Rhizobium rosettiformans]